MKEERGIGGKPQNIVLVPILRLKCSTNEELQATLQELTDLQDQLTDLQLENERCCDEKALLLESLCSQTEKLEECRSHNDHLRALLFGHGSPPPPQASSSSSPAVAPQLSREQHYVELLKVCFHACVPFSRELLG